NTSCEISPHNFVILNSRPLPGSTSLASGIGGIADRLYACDNGADRLYELNPDTLTSIRSANAPKASPSGIGGISNRLYHCDSGWQSNYELNPNTLSVINEVSAPGNSAH